MSIAGHTVHDRAETYLRCTMENDDSHVLVRELLEMLMLRSPPDSAMDRMLRQRKVPVAPVTFALRIEDTSGLSQGVPLTDELLASCAISLKRIADELRKLASPKAETAKQARGAAKPRVARASAKRNAPIPSPLPSIADRSRQGA